MLRLKNQCARRTTTKEHIKDWVVLSFQTLKRHLIVGGGCTTLAGLVWIALETGIVGYIEQQFKPPPKPAATPKIHIEKCIDCINISASGDAIISHKTPLEAPLNLAKKEERVTKKSG